MRASNLGKILGAVGLLLLLSSPFTLFLTFTVLLPWMLLSGVAQAVDEPLRSVLSYLSFDAQLQNMLKGVMDVQSLVFFASVIVFSLLLTHRTVEAQRWA